MSILKISFNEINESILSKSSEYGDVLIESWEWKNIKIEKEIARRVPLIFEDINFIYCIRKNWGSNPLNRPYIGFEIKKFAKGEGCFEIKIKDALFDSYRINVKVIDVDGVKKIKAFWMYHKSDQGKVSC